MTLAAIAMALLAAAPAAPAESDEEVWTLARKVNSAPAFETYLLRFPLGKHRKRAIRAFYRTQGLPVIEAPPEPPLPPIFVMPPPPSTKACTALLTGQAPYTLDSEERRDYLAARSANRPAVFQAYRAKYPDGACTGEAAFALRFRHRFSDRFKPIAGFGPIAAKRLSQPEFNDYDYPVRARRHREAGKVVAEWDVALDGFAEGCRIVQSSGSAPLDEASCRLAVTRIRYDPARNRAGVPVRSTDSEVFDWILPPHCIQGNWCVTPISESTPRGSTRGEEAAGRGVIPALRSDAVHA
jgi:TonB family protein